MAPRIKLVVADASMVVRRGIGAILQGEECEVVGTAANLAETYYRIRTCRPDVVVFDDLGGHPADILDFLRKVQAECPGLRLLWLPPRATGDQVEAYMGAGVAGIELQGCSEPALLRAVQQVHAGLHPVAAEFTVSILRDYRVLASSQRHALLTSRQTEILKLIAAGQEGRVIATTLSYSGSTIKREIRNIFNRLGANDRAAAVATAKDRRLI